MEKKMEERFEKWSIFHFPQHRSWNIPEQKIIWKKFVRTQQKIIKVVFFLFTFIFFPCPRSSRFPLARFSSSFQAIIKLSERLLSRYVRNTSHSQNTSHLLFPLSLSLLFPNFSFWFSILRSEPESWEGKNAVPKNRIPLQWPLVNICSLYYFRFPEK